MERGELRPNIEEEAPKYEAVFNTTNNSLTIDGTELTLENWEPDLVLKLANNGKTPLKLLADILVEKHGQMEAFAGKRVGETLMDLNDAYEKDDLFIREGVGVHMTYSFNAKTEITDGKPKEDVQEVTDQPKVEAETGTETKLSRIIEPLGAAFLANKFINLNGTDIFDNQGDPILTFEMDKDTLGLADKVKNSYSGGRPDDATINKSRTETLEAISEIMLEKGLNSISQQEENLAQLLAWFRAYLEPYEKLRSNITQLFIEKVQTGGNNEKFMELSFNKALEPYKSPATREREANQITDEKLEQLRRTFAPPQVVDKKALEPVAEKQKNRTYRDTRQTPDQTTFRARRIVETTTRVEVTQREIEEVEIEVNITRPQPDKKPAKPAQTQPKSEKTYSPKKENSQKSANILKEAKKVDRKFVERSATIIARIDKVGLVSYTDSQVAHFFHLNHIFIRGAVESGIIKPEPDGRGFIISPEQVATLIYYNNNKGFKPKFYANLFPYYRSQLGRKSNQGK